SMASTFFWCWHIMQESFLSFPNSPSWYLINTLRSGKDLHKPMTYNMHYAGITPALASIGLESQAKTHVGQRPGARMAELSGASDDHIRHSELLC
ncbi:hypothetical protein DFS34DRAFT_575751, partial [Phlyctochytrium arcticum]